MKTNTLNDLLLEYLMNNYGWHKKVNLFVLADEWGYSPDTLSRALRKLAEEGKIFVQYYDGRYSKNLAMYCAEKPPEPVMDWFLERLQQSDPTLDYQDLCNHKTDFKKLVDLKIIKHLHNVEILMCEWCDDPHSVSLFRNKKNEVILSCSGSRRIIDPDELKVWTINKDTLIENVKSKNAVVDKNAFEKSAFVSKGKSSNTDNKGNI